MIQTQHFTNSSSYSTVDNLQIWPLQKFTKHNYSQILLPIQLWTTHRFDHCKHFSNTTFHKHFLLNCGQLTGLATANISQTQHFTNNSYSTVDISQIWPVQKFLKCNISQNFFLFNCGQLTNFNQCKQFSNTKFPKHFFLFNCGQLTNFNQCKNFSNTTFPKHLFLFNCGQLTNFNQCKKFSNTTFPKHFFLFNCGQLTNFNQCKQFLNTKFPQTLLSIQLWTTHRFDQCKSFSNTTFHNTSSYSTVDNSQIWPVQTILKHNLSQTLLAI